MIPELESVWAPVPSPVQFGASNSRFGLELLWSRYLVPFQEHTRSTDENQPGNDPNQSGRSSKGDSEVDFYLRWKWMSHRRSQS